MQKEYEMKVLTKNKANLLKLFLTNPEKSFYMQEIGRILSKKPGVFQRTLNNMVDEISDTGGNPPKKNIKDTPAGELPTEPKSKTGEVYQLGNHRVMCGDCTVNSDAEKLMNNDVAQMVFTDPPYGVSYQSNSRTKTEKFDILKNDNTIIDIAPVINKHSTGFVFIWSTWKVINKWIENMKAIGEISNMVVWFKGGGGLGDLKKTFGTDWELALVYNRGHELEGKRIGSVWSIKKDAASKYIHPTQKPVALAEEAIGKCSKPGYIVADFFGGSGSTLIGCENLKRKCYMMEFEPAYVDVIIDRWERHTGRKAEKVN